MNGVHTVEVDVVLLVAAREAALDLVEREAADSCGWLASRRSELQQDRRQGSFVSDARPEPARTVVALRILRALVLDDVRALALTQVHRATREHDRHQKTRSERKVLHAAAPESCKRR